MSKTDGRPGNVVELRQSDSQSAGKAVTAFVRDHPLLVVAGGVAIGAVVAALLPRGTSRKLALRAASLAEAASAAGVLIGSKARDGAEAAGAGLREQGGALADRLGDLSDSASERLGKFGDNAGARIEKLIDPVEHAASGLAKRASEKASALRALVHR